jgi:oxidase EvaA
VLRLLFRARPEIGFREKLQLGPTLQDPGDGFLPTSPIADEGRPLLATTHSEEGGRFFRCVTRHEVRLGDAAGDDVIPLTLAQVRRLVRRAGVFTNEARTLVSMLLSHA